MTERRNQLTHGLTLTLRHGRALLWTYAANLGLALLFAARLHSQLNDILAHSMASQRLTTAFDLGVALDALRRVFQDAPSAGASPYYGLPLYVLLYFLIVPGALWCFQTGGSARLSTLLHQGLLHFWRFVRITLIALVVSGLILGPLFAAHNALTERADKHLVGVPMLVHKLFTLSLVLLVAALLRLYFDLVEAYTVQLGQRTRENGKPDRRVRRTLLPALRTLFRGLLANYLTFLLLAVLGLAAVFLTARTAMHTLAQPHVWPQFVLAQIGLFLMLLTRYWQRGASTTLALNNPLPLPVIEPVSEPVPEPANEPVREPEPVMEEAMPATSVEPKPEVLELHPADPIPDPEPIAPSLPEPDPGVFHHEVHPEPPAEEQDPPLG